MEDPPAPSTSRPATAHSAWVAHPDPVPYAPRPVASTPGFAVASLVLGLAGICTVWVVWIPLIGWLSLAPAILAIIFGGIALAQINRTPSRGGRGLAVTGLVLGIIVAVLGLPFRLLWFGL